jgi:hypothetical protein
VVTWVPGPTCPAIACSFAPSKLDLEFGRFGGTITLGNLKGSDTNKMRRIRLPEWTLNFLLGFLMASSFFCLRKLHAVGQPVLGTVIDALGFAALFALSAHLLDIFGKKRPNP